MTASPAVWLFGLLTAASVGYYLSVILAGVRFRADAWGRAQRPIADQPPISILKPIRGADPFLAETLRSHARLAYPSFELVFGVADPADPALDEIERLQQEFPDLRVQVHVCGPPTGGNAKVELLERLAAAARHDLLLVNDADIRLEPGDLAALVCDFPESVGLTTTLYRARPGSTWASRFDAAWVSGDFAGQALTGFYLAKLSFALGATMLLRSSDLERIGGFAAIRPYLADDYELGRRIAALGKPVRLSAVVVETVMGAPSWKEVWLRHLRWSRTIRASRPGGHLGFGMTFGTLWALLLWAAGGPGWAVACAIVGRLAANAGAGANVDGRLGLGYFLGPLVELWSAAVWLASFAGREVVWRGHRLCLDGHGRITGPPN